MYAPAVTKAIITGMAGRPGTWWDFYTIAHKTQHQIDNVRLQYLLDDMVHDGYLEMRTHPLGFRLRPPQKRYVPSTEERIQELYDYRIAQGGFDVGGLKTYLGERYHMKMRALRDEMEDLEEAGVDMEEIERQWSRAAQDAVAEDAETETMKAAPRTSHRAESAITTATRKHFLNKRGR